MIGIVLALALTQAQPACALSKRPPKGESMTSSWKGQYCKESAPGTLVIHSAKEWQKLWKETLSAEPPRSVDFSSHMAVAVFAGLKNTGGYRVEILEPQAKDGALEIPYKIIAPDPSGFVTMALTQPYAVAIFPKTTLTPRPVERP